MLGSARGGNVLCDSLLFHQASLAFVREKIISLIMKQPTTNIYVRKSSSWTSLRVENFGTGNISPCTCARTKLLRMPSPRDGRGRQKVIFRRSKIYCRKFMKRFPPPWKSLSMSHRIDFSGTRKGWGWVKHFIYMTENIDDILTFPS